MTLTYQRFTAALLLIYGSVFLSGIYYCLRVFWCAAARMSELELEQRTNVKFLVKLGKSGNEIREMLVQVYGDNAMKKTAVYKWAKCFSEGKGSVTNEERSRQLATSRTEEDIVNIRHILHKNHWLTVRNIAEQVNIDRETVRKILTEDLDMRKGCAKMVPKELTEEQKQRRVTICQDFMRGKMTFLAVSSQIMKHESTNTTLKRSGNLHNGRLPIPHDQKILSVQIKSQNNVADFFYIRGIVHYEFVPNGQRVSQLYYLEVLERLSEKVRRRRPELFANKSWILHHDNAPAHTALSVGEFLATKQITVFKYPAYSPDLAPNDFYLFPKIKEIFKGRHFDELMTSGVIQRQL